MFQKFLVKFQRRFGKCTNPMRKLFNDNLNILVVGGSVAGLSTAIESIRWVQKGFGSREAKHV